MAIRASLTPNHLQFNVGKLSLTLVETSLKLLVGTRNVGSQMLDAREDQTPRKAAEASEHIPKRIPVVTIKVGELQRAGKKLVNFLHCVHAREVDTYDRAVFRIGVHLWLSIAIYAWHQIQHPTMFKHPV